ncbi:transcription initiation factor IIB [Halorarius halobius]|uniref:transcription initiation factor IIB n=1 Tax=Halorarius halobius TaxID=2962671 RepID=UPI0020CC6616|nr:transcription initiation factor IIB family protein [Halorarius halobius]
MRRANVYERRYDESTEQTDANTCPECGGRVTMNRAETVCDDCGLVLADDQVDLGPEWRSFEDGPNRDRTGAPRTAARHDRGLSTEIGRGEDANGNALSVEKRRRLGRLRREQRRTQRRSKRERNEMVGLTEIRRLCGALGIGTSLRDQACRLFSTAQQRDLLRGRSIEAMAAASLYAACRCNGRPQTLADVVAVAQVDGSAIRASYDAVNRELELPAKPVPPARFLPQFVSALDLSQAVEQRARAVLSGTRTPETHGANPAGVAAGALLVAAGDEGELQRFTQAELAALADVSIPTVRRYRNELGDKQVPGLAAD